MAENYVILKWLKIYITSIFSTADFWWESQSGNWVNFNDNVNFVFEFEIWVTVSESHATAAQLQM